METVNCHVCDGTEYTLMNGVYVCNECGVQSTAMREEYVDFSGHLRTTLRDQLCREEDHELVNSTQIDKPKALLSWECFNLILLGLTDEIIELGADPSLKIVVLQIWVRYLQVIEGAFTSKRSQKLPKLNTCIVNTDGEILYGIKNLKRKLLEPKRGPKRRRGKNVKSQTKKRSVLAMSSNLSDSMTLSQNRIKQSRLLRKIDTLKNSTHVDTPLSNDLSLLQRSTKMEKVKVKLSTLMKNAMNLMPSKSVDLTDNSSKSITKKMQKSWEKSKYKDKKNHLTVKKLISIIQLGLMINKDDIYISDLLRWIHEGHFHVNRVNLFLPPDALHSIPLSAMIRNTSRHALNLEFIMLLRYLHFKQMPNTDLQKLAVRFCEELQLPEGFTKFVCKLLLLLPPNMEIKTVLPDPEIKVMAYILFAAKILFCLDGSTEEFSSKFAEIINKSMNLKEKLFNWNDYVTFIECRNAVVSKHNYLLHKDLYGGRIRNTELFINDWMMMQSSLPIQKRGQLNKKFSDNAKVLFKALPKTGGPLNFRQIPNATKPLAFTLEWIFENYRNELSEKSFQLLKQDFARTDISYLTNEERIKDLSQQCDVPIEITYDEPSHYVKEKKNKDDTTGPHCGKHILSTANVNVKLLDCSLDDKILENVYTAVKEKPNTIFLGKGCNYWFLHFKVKFLKDTSMAKVYEVFDEQLPDSFLWFMKQCRRIVDCKLTELYMELIRVEKKFEKFVGHTRL